VPLLFVKISVSFAEPKARGSVFLEPARFAPSFHTEQHGWRIRAACVAEGQPVGIDWEIMVGG
jgi:hypothetical protein